MATQRKNIKVNAEYDKLVKETQARAKKVGHCICEFTVKCPCDMWKRYEICKCANIKKYYEKL